MMGILDLPSAALRQALPWRDHVERRACGPYGDTSSGGWKRPRSSRWMSGSGAPSAPDGRPPFAEGPQRRGAFPQRERAKRLPGRPVKAVGRQRGVHPRVTRCITAAPASRGRISARAVSARPPSRSCYFPSLNGRGGDPGAPGVRSVSAAPRSGADRRIGSVEVKAAPGFGGGTWRRRNPSLMLRL